MPAQLGYSRGTLLCLQLGLLAVSAQQFPLRGICRGGVPYTSAELNRLVPRATRQALRVGNFYTHTGVGSGICGVQSVDKCYRLCNATRGCNFYSISTTVPCYACFVSRSCDPSTVTYESGYSTYQMPTSSPTASPTRHPCDTYLTNSCDRTSTYCTRNTSGLPSISGSAGAYACACRPQFPIRTGANTCASPPPTAIPTTTAPTGTPTFHPCIGGQHACQTPSTYCTDTIGANMTAIGQGASAYACACNTSAGYTLRLSSWACDIDPLLYTDDDPATNTLNIATLNATVSQLQATVAQQATTINQLLSALRAAAASTIPTPTQPVGNEPSVTSLGDGSLKIRGSTVAVETATCASNDLCRAASFAVALKSQLENL